MTSQNQLHEPARETHKLNRDLQRLNQEIKRPEGDDPLVDGVDDTLTRDLFAWGARQRQFRETGSLSLRHDPVQSPPHWIERSEDLPRRRKLSASYLYNESSRGLKPERYTRSVRRNRILFIGLLVGLGLYLILSLSGCG